MNILWKQGVFLEHFRSPLELTTLFLVLSIGLYVVIFWRSQIEAKRPRVPERRKSHRPLNAHPRRRVSDRGSLENLVINQLFEDDETGTGSVTNH